ncbi:MAG: hypothetical protein ACW963_01895 [Candidatus Sifarchaeia archaeon]|jgi:hypothetical protein
MKLNLAKITKKSSKKSQKIQPMPQLKRTVQVEYATISGGVGNVDYDTASGKWGFYSKGRWQYLPPVVQQRCEDLAEVIEERYGSSGYPEGCEPHINFKIRDETWFE